MKEEKKAEEIAALLLFLFVASCMGLAFYQTFIAEYEPIDCMEDKEPDYNCYRYYGRHSKQVSCETQHDWHNMYYYYQVRDDCYYTWDKVYGEVGK